MLATQLELDAPRCDEALSRTPGNADDLALLASQCTAARHALITVAQMESAMNHLRAKEANHLLEKFIRKEERDDSDAEETSAESGPDPDGTASPPAPVGTDVADTAFQEAASRLADVQPLSGSVPSSSDDFFAELPPLLFESRLPEPASLPVPALAPCSSWERKMDAAQPLDFGAPGTAVRFAAPDQ